MKLTVDPEADALYLRLNDAQIIDSEMVAPGVVLDYDTQDNVVGIEMLHLSKRAHPADLQRLLFETLSATNVLAPMDEGPMSFSIATEADGLPVIRARGGVISPALVREIEGLTL